VVEQAVTDSSAGQSSRGPYHYGRQFIDDDDIAAVCEALKSDFLTTGPAVEKFERRIAEYCGARYCVAVDNGTAALHLACIALGLGPGDVGWTTPLTFAATGNAVLHAGSRIDFVDIDPGTLNLSPARLQEKLAGAEQAQSLPKVVLPVHFAGQSCDMKAIRALADRHGSRIIEDGCQALGGSYDGGRIGDCRYSDVVVFSLHPVKSITTGEGGLVLTNDGDLFEAIRRMRTHGITRGNVEEKSIPWRAEMISDGFNYRITAFQCALGLSQMDKLDGFVTKRALLAGRYRERLRDAPIRFQTPDSAAESAWHLMVAMFDFDAIGLSKIELYDALKERGINLSLHYYPLHLHAYYRAFGFSDGMFPAAEAYYQQAFTLPLHVGLEFDDIDHICEQINEFLS